jgi:hypothetical protein
MPRLRPTVPRSDNSKENCALFSVVGIGSSPPSSSRKHSRNGCLRRSPIFSICVAGRGLPILAGGSVWVVQFDGKQKGVVSFFCSMSSSGSFINFVLLPIRYHRNRSPYGRSHKMFPQYWIRE